MPMTAAGHCIGPLEFYSNHGRLSARSAPKRGEVATRLPRLSRLLRRMADLSANWRVSSLRQVDHVQREFHSS